MYMSRLKIARKIKQNVRMFKNINTIILMLSILTFNKISNMVSLFSKIYFGVLKINFKFIW